MPLSNFKILFDFTYTESRRFCRGSLIVALIALSTILLCRPLFAQVVSNAALEDYIRRVVHPVVYERVGGAPEALPPPATIAVQQEAGGSSIEIRSANGLYTIRFTDQPIKIYPSLGTPEVRYDNGVLTSSITVLVPSIDELDLLKHQGLVRSMLVADHALHPMMPPVVRLNAAQAATYERLRAAASEGRAQHSRGATKILLTMPTGTGKTVVAAHFARDELNQPNTMVIFVGPTNVVNASALRHLVRETGAPIDSVYVAASQLPATIPGLAPPKTDYLKKLPSNARIVVTTRPTFAKHIDVLLNTLSERGLRPVVIIDEVHAIGAAGMNDGVTVTNEDAQYAQIITAMAGFQNPATILGLSATPMANHGEVASYFDHRIVFGQSTRLERLAQSAPVEAWPSLVATGVRDAIAMGYLQPIRSVQVIDPLKDSGTRNKKPARNHWAKAIVDAGKADAKIISSNRSNNARYQLPHNDALYAVLKRIYARIKQSGSRAIIMVDEVNSARWLAHHLNSLHHAEHGSSNSNASPELAKVVVGADTGRDVEDALNWYTQPGDARALVTVDMLRVGADLPGTNLLVLLNSMGELTVGSAAALYQILGRGVRIAQGQTGLDIILCPPHLEIMGSVLAGTMVARRGAFNGQQREHFDLRRLSQRRSDDGTITGELQTVDDLNELAVAQRSGSVNNASSLDSAFDIYNFRNIILSELRRWSNNAQLPLQRFLLNLSQITHGLEPLPVDAIRTLEAINLTTDSVSAEEYRALHALYRFIETLAAHYRKQLGGNPSSPDISHLIYTASGLQTVLFDLWPNLALLGESYNPTERASVQALLGGHNALARQTVEDYLQHQLRHWPAGDRTTLLQRWAMLLDDAVIPARVPDSQRTQMRQALAEVLRRPIHDLTWSNARHVRVWHYLSALHYLKQLPHFDEVALHRVLTNASPDSALLGVRATLTPVRSVLRAPTLPGVPWQPRPTTVPTQQQQSASTTAPVAPLSPPVAVVTPEPAVTPVRSSPTAAPTPPVAVFRDVAAQFVDREASRLQPLSRFAQAYLLSVLSPVSSPITETPSLPDAHIINTIYEKLLEPLLGIPGLGTVATDVAGSYLEQQKSTALANPSNCWLTVQRTLVYLLYLSGQHGAEYTTTMQSVYQLHRLLGHLELVRAHDSVPEVFHDGSYFAEHAHKQTPTAAAIPGYLEPLTNAAFAAPEGHVHYATVRRIEAQLRTIEGLSNDQVRQLAFLLTVVAEAPAKNGRSVTDFVRFLQNNPARPFEQNVALLLQELTVVKRAQSSASAALPAWIAAQWRLPLPTVVQAAPTATNNPTSNADQSPQTSVFDSLKILADNPIAGQKALVGVLHISELDCTNQFGPEQGALLYRALTSGLMLTIFQFAFSTRDGLDIGLAPPIKKETTQETASRRVLRVEQFERWLQHVAETFLEGRYAATFETNSRTRMDVVRRSLLLSDTIAGDVIYLQTILQAIQELLSLHRQEHRLKLSQRMRDNFGDPVENSDPIAQTLHDLQYNFARMLQMHQMRLPRFLKSFGAAVSTARELHNGVFSERVQPLDIFEAFEPLLRGRVLSNGTGRLDGDAIGVETTKFYEEAQSTLASYLEFLTEAKTRRPLTSQEQTFWNRYTEGKLLLNDAVWVLINTFPANIQTLMRDNLQQFQKIYPITAFMQAAKLKTRSLEVTYTLALLHYFNYSLFRLTDLTFVNGDAPPDKQLRTLTHILLRPAAFFSQFKDHTVGRVGVVEEVLAQPITSADWAHALEGEGAASENRVSALEFVMGKMQLRLWKTPAQTLAGHWAFSGTFTGQTGWMGLWLKRRMEQEREKDLEPKRPTTSGTLLNSLTIFQDFYQTLAGPFNRTGFLEAPALPDGKHPDLIGLHEWLKVLSPWLLAVSSEVWDLAQLDREVAQLYALALRLPDAVVGARFPEKQSQVGLLLNAGWGRGVPPTRRRRNVELVVASGDVFELVTTFFTEGLSRFTRTQQALVKEFNRMTLTRIRAGNPDVVSPHNVINSHGGNEALLEVLRRRLGADHDICVQALSGGGTE